jgi:tetratricopeptide (TPR) repeat protein
LIGKAAAACRCSAGKEPGLAIFGKAFGGSSSDGPTPADYSPDRAQKFFDHAKTAMDTDNFEYAIQHFCNGLKQDPRVTAGLDGLWNAVVRFKETPAGKKGPSKETWKAIAGTGDTAKFVSALLEWAVTPTDTGLALKAAELAGKVKADAVGETVIDQAMKLAAKEAKPRKDQFLKISEAYRLIERHDKSLMAAERALAIDPTDGDLAAKIRTLAASATMQKGGYEQAGTEGGFRKMIKDADKQKQLTEQDAIVKTGETLDRIIVQVEADYDSRPTDQYAIQKYVERLIERGGEADERRAVEVLRKGYQDTQQIRFKIRVGELELKSQRKKLADLEAAMTKYPDDPDLRGVYEHEKSQFFERSAEEFKTRIAAYPTDNTHKFDLAKLYFVNDRPQDAIGLLQEIQNDAKIKPIVLNMLGESFLKIEFLPEAVATFRQACEVREVSSDFAMELKYNLMRALRKTAENDGDLPAAEEANKIASSIVMQNVKFRDINTQRSEINKLVQQLKNK